MSSRPCSYSIYGYDRDDDIYELIGYGYDCADIAIVAAKYLSTQSPKRTDNNRIFDWIEVVHEDSGVRQYVLPCV